MAKTEQISGIFSKAKNMAGNIVTSQSAEITKMRALLRRPPHRRWEPGGPSQRMRAWNERNRDRRGDPGSPGAAVR